LRRLLDADRMSGVPGARQKQNKKGKREKGMKRLRATERWCQEFRADCSSPDAIEYEPSSNWVPDAVLHASIREHAKDRVVAAHYWASSLRAD